MEKVGKLLEEKEDVRFLVLGLPFQRGLVFSGTKKLRAILALFFGDLDVSERDFHHVSGMELEAEGAGFDGGVGGVGDAFDSVEPCFVGVSFDFDFEGVPVLGFDGSDGFLAFGWVAFFWDVGCGGEVALEGAGDADLDLIVGALEHDAGVDFPFAVFEFESEGEVGKFFFGPKDGAFVFGTGFAVDGAFLDGPVWVVGFGIDAPVGEVFSVEEGFSTKEGAEEKDRDKDAHGENGYGVDRESLSEMNVPLRRRFSKMR